MPATPTPHSQTDLEARKTLGRARLRENRIEDALRIYASILKDYPKDIDACLFIGDCYLAENDNETALLMYNQALQIDPSHPAIQSRLKLARGMAFQPGGLAEASNSGSQENEVARLLQRLIGRSSPVSEEEVNRAAQLLNDMIHQPHPARVVAARLNEIDELLPALLEVNIRQARADGRPDVAEALENLRDNIQLQLGVLPAAAVNSPAKNSDGAGTIKPAAAKPEPAPTRVLILTGPSAGELVLRAALAAEGLQQRNFRVIVADYAPKETLPEYQCVLFFAPHRDAKLLELLAYCSAAKIPTVVDLNLDYEQMPVDHPDYEKMGLGTLDRSKAYTNALLLADRVSVSSASLAASLHARAVVSQVVPDSWSMQNPLWLKSSPQRRTVQIGWMAHSGQLEDAVTIRRVLVRICREFTQARLVVAGDPQVYQLFESMPDTSRLFLPAVTPEDYPYLFSQMDLLVVPLRNNAFNRSLSDRFAMEAGARSIPWVASSIPAFNAWKAGGLIANNMDEWHTHLRQLIMEPSLRVELGRAGHAKAETREAARIGQSWAELIINMLHPAG